MPSPRAKLDRHSWNAAVCAMREAVQYLTELPGLSADERHALNAVVKMSRDMTASKCLPPDLSNLTLSRKYGISDRTVTNWRKEGCPFEKGKRYVLPWMAKRRYVPAAAEAKFKRRLDLLRIRENVKYCQDGIAALRHIKLMSKVAGQPDPGLSHLRAQNRTGRGSGTPQSEFWRQLQAGEM